MIVLSLVLWYLTVPLIEGGCPSVCSCTTDSVNCTDKTIECIPSFESLVNQPRVIDLSGNAIQIVDYDDFSFDASVYVIEIYLNSSGLIEIEDKAFNEMVKLQSLYLDDNLLTDIPANMIKENKDMVLLNLSENEFSTMPKIRSISLEVLALASCKIETVPSDSLTHLPNIKTLILQHNNIKELAQDMFANVPRFFAVTLHQNAWNCNCKTIDLFSHLINRKLVDRESSVYCRSEALEFVNIYETGVIEKYKDQCGVNSDRDTAFSVSLLRPQSEIVKGDLKQTSNLIEVNEEAPATYDIVGSGQNCPISAFDYVWIFTVTITVVVVSFMSGFCMGRRHSAYIGATTDSKFELILP